MRSSALPTATSIYTSDGTATGTSMDTLTIAALKSASVGDAGGVNRLHSHGRHHACTISYLLAPGATDQMTCPPDDLT